VRLLVLGGTVFLGRAVVESALAGGHEVTLFTRGRTNPGLFPDAERLRGDRDGDLRALEGRTWEAVVDTCGFVPRIVRQSAELLEAAVERYVFVSSVSAYADLSSPPDESAPLAQLEDADSEEVMRDYGGLKAACERVVEDVFGDRATIVRPGLIVGPHDPTGRFTYWPRRVAGGGAVLAPGPPEAPVQIIDVRDLGDWLVALAKRGPGGAFNAIGPSEPLTFGEMLEACRAATGSGAKLVWVDGERLVEAGVEPWSDLPLWLPGDEHAGMLRTPVARAVAAGLRFRPLAVTIVDTLAWDAEVGGEPPRQEDGRYKAQTISRERESELLARL
jgi:nucleoside-diphosphate-sugar epimerase